jgi:hypothetical protein
VPLLALIIAAVAVFGVEQKVDQAAVNATVAKQLAESQSQGRRIALGVTCGALRGVEDAGRAVITQRLPVLSAGESARGAHAGGDRSGV